MKVILVAIVVLLFAAIGCSDQPTSVPPSPMPTPTPVVCQSHDWMFEKKGSVHDDYQAICVEEGGYYVYLTLSNQSDQIFSLSLLQGDTEPKLLYDVGTKVLDDAAVALFEVCSYGCDATPGNVRLEVDAPDAPASVEWAIRVEQKAKPE